MNSDLSVVQPYRTIPDERWVTAVVSAHYDFTVESCRLLLAGVNDHFMVETDSNLQFAVRLYRSGCSKERIETELRFLAHLNDEGVSVSTAVPTMSGELLTSCGAPEGRRYLVVFTWAPGRAQKDEDASSFGKALAQLHAAADEFAQHDLLQLDLREAIRTGGAYLQSLPLDDEGRQLLPKALERVESNLELVLSSDPDIGGCHGDSHAGNANVSDDTTVTFFDFDFCCTGPRAFDLATFKWCNEVWDTNSDTVWNQFISGYRSVRSLSDGEVRNALLLRPVRHMWWLAFWRTHENRFGISTLLGNNQPASYVQRLMKWTEILDSDE